MASARCPRGHAGVVVKAGTYGPTKAAGAPTAPGAPKAARVRTGPRRQLWWCYPQAKAGQAGGAVDKTDAHRFAEAMPRQLLPVRAVAHTCAECSTELELHEGPPHVRSYEYAARLVAAALVSVGQGTSYHQAAKSVRQVSGWSRRTTGRPRAGANGTLAGDWVGLFGPLVTDPVLAGETWPEVVALDELPFGCSAPRRAAYLAQLEADALRDKKVRLGPSATLTAREEKELKKQAQQQLSWVVFGAWSPRVGQAGQLFRLGAGARLDHQHAAKFLLSVPGRPKVVVCDGGGSWPKAVALAWPPLADENGVVTTPSPRLVKCEHHLKESARSALRVSGVLPPRLLESEQPTRPQGGIPWPPQPTRLRPVPIDAGFDAAAWPVGKQRTRTGMNRLHAAAVRAGRGDEVRFATLTEEDAERHPLTRAVERAFYSVETWDELVALAELWQADGLRGWLTRNAAVRDQLLTRDPTDPRSIGGLEAALQTVKGMVKDRSSQLTNTVRTQRLLDLMTLHVRGVADERTYAMRLTEALATTGGRAPVQRVGVRNAPKLHL